MAQPAPDIAPAPVHRSQPVARLNREAPTAFEIALTEDELARTAAYLGLSALNELGFRGKIAAWDKDGWEVSADLTAIVVQECVVTLAPVTQYIEEAVSRRYQPGLEPQTDIDIIVGADETDDGPDPLGDEIDLAGLMLESLALALDPYPRAEGAALETAVFAEPGVTPMTDEDARPFAKLAALRAKLGDTK